MSKIFMITGSNSGLGLDASRQLALRDDVKKVYLTARSKDKAEKAIEGLVAKGISKDKFDFILFNASDSKSEIEAAAALPKGTVLDGIVMNAGGIGSDIEGKPTGPNNVLPIVQINLVGHLHLISYYIQQGNLVNNKSRIIFVGTEGSRGIPMIGMKSPEFTGETAEYFKTFLNGSAYTKYNAMDVAYPVTKGVATMYFSAFARAHPELYVVTVSPGGTKGTEFASQEGINPIMAFLFPIMMKVMTALGKFHELEVGAKRYVDALTGEGQFANDAFQSGTFVASKSGVVGPLADQAETFPTAKQYGDVKKQDAVFTAVNEFL